MPRRSYAQLTVSRAIIAGGMLLLLGSVPACWRSFSTSVAEAPLPRKTRAETPALLAQQLLWADREWSRSAVSSRFPEALVPMFTAQVKMPLRDQILSGPTAVLGAFSASADTGAVVRWIPVRVGLAADGQHGFTAGVQLLTRANGTRAAARYLSFWIREARPAGEGRWKVVAWRRRPLNHAVPDTGMLPAVLPSTIIPPATDHAATEAHYRSLIAAEQSFSDEANRNGVGVAFARLGDAEALNMGRPEDTTFARGPTAIAVLVAGGLPLNAPSTIRWSADTAIVATSGDLGITFGVIRQNQVTPNAAASGAAFFTIWRRDSLKAPWRYVAE